MYLKKPRSLLFLGVCANYDPSFAIGEFRTNADYQYQLLRCNVDLLRIIQLGLTFLDDSGNTPGGYTTWQFNFKFNLQ